MARASPDGAQERSAIVGSARAATGKRRHQGFTDLDVVTFGSG